MFLLMEKMTACFGRNWEVNGRVYDSPSDRP